MAVAARFALVDARCAGGILNDASRNAPTFRVLTESCFEQPECGCLGPKSPRADHHAEGTAEALMCEASAEPMDSVMAISEYIPDALTFRVLTESCFIGCSSPLHAT